MSSLLEEICFQSLIHPERSFLSNVNTSLPLSYGSLLVSKLHDKFELKEK